MSKICFLLYNKYYNYWKYTFPLSSPLAHTYYEQDSTVSTMKLRQVRQQFH